MSDVPSAGSSSATQSAGSEAGASRATCAESSCVSKRRATHQGCWVVGLTGSIGMGKSTVADMLRELGVSVSDADAAVHAMYSKGGAAVPLIAVAFPEAIVDDEVSRPALSKLVVGNPEALKKLEQIVHPLVKAARDDFLRQSNDTGEELVVLDIPLLFEKQLEHECDEVLVVSAPADVQRQRVLARPNMRALPDDVAAAKLDAIIAKQTPDAEKRARADVVIDTAVPLEETRAAVAEFVDSRRRRVRLRRRAQDQRRLLLTATAWAVGLSMLVLILRKLKAA